MERVFQKLCFKLDALSNFALQPKAVLPKEIKIRSSVPALKMEVCRLPRLRFDPGQSTGRKSPLPRPSALVQPLTMRPWFNP